MEQHNVISDHKSVYKLVMPRLEGCPVVDLSTGIHMSHTSNREINPIRTSHSQTIHRVNTSILFCLG